MLTMIMRLSSSVGLGRRRSAGLVPSSQVVTRLAFNSAAESSQDHQHRVNMLCPLSTSKAPRMRCHLVEVPGNTSSPREPLDIEPPRCHVRSR
ncbi:hypothetical protein CSOJ01_06554 [Colletotrichum sojae]|uniref:Uncharacterized protein n=1 Tax=Colletotrichum sojae TaxID=2175907 RepID=A0A8H6MVV1_9PEZI|nr:hypothetical protein CSOJ01_06554 [Colletotrichum sojae]